MIIKTEAIVLKTFDYRETSRIARFFTKDHGKVSGVLKGIRKDPKKFGSHVERYSVNDIVYYQYRNSDLHLISHCDLKQYYFPIRQDYKRSVAANYILELVDVIMPVEQRNRAIYELLLCALKSLESVDDIDKLIYVYQIKMLSYSGFRPHVDSCVKCQKQIHDKGRFSLRLGGLICPHCPTTETHFTPISKGTISTMLHVEDRDWMISLKLGLAVQVRRELKYLLNNFLVYHLEKKIRSSRYL
jgi:DNA repair protein RecO (recombination protein O)